MKKITNFITEKLVSVEKLNAEPLRHVMTFANFKTWLKKYAKKDENISIVSVVDYAMDIQKLLKDKSQQGYLDYDEKNKKWTVEIENDFVDVDDLTLTDDDIIIIWY